MSDKKHPIKLIITKLPKKYQNESIR